MTANPLSELDRFCDAMEREHQYRPTVLANGVLANSRDADRYEGWLLAMNRRTPAVEGEQVLALLLAGGFVAPEKVDQAREIVSQFTPAASSQPAVPKGMFRSEGPDGWIFKASDGRIVAACPKGYAVVREDDKYAAKELK
ncbi:MAG: hypothetical protein ACREO0_15105 [Pseudoxanthomonas sp.]